jgi:hypothetical protein
LTLAFCIICVAQQAFDLRPTVASDPFADMLSGLSLGGPSYGMPPGYMHYGGGQTGAFGSQQSGPPATPLPGFLPAPPAQQPPPTQPAQQPPPPDVSNPMTVTPCAFCGGQRHAMEKCTFYLSARKQHQAKQATDRAATEAARAAAAAAAAAAGAGNGAPSGTPP